jgi:hypothetical protein
LLQKKISKPNAGVSCIKSVFRLFNGQWNWKRLCSDRLLFYFLLYKRCRKRFSKR